MLKPTQNTGISVEMSLVNCLKRGALLKKKLPQTRDGYTPKPSMRDAAE